MSDEHPERENISNASPHEPEMLALIKQVQQHLVFLEKKIDILVRRFSHRPPKEKRFSKPIRPEIHTGDRVRAESGLSSSGRPGSFGPSHGGQDHGFGRRKKRPFRYKKRWH